MDYSLQAIYYLVRGYINLLLQVEVTAGVTVGGVLLSSLLMSALFAALGFGMLRLHGDIPDQPALPNYGGHRGATRGDNFTMR